MKTRSTFRHLILTAILLLLPTVAHAGNWFNGTVSNSVGTRNYKLWIPSSYTGKKALPLVMMLHGCTQTPDDFAAGTRMNAIADKENFLVVYPEQPVSANALKCWNWFDAANQSRGQGEPLLLAEMISRISGSYKVDPRRVFVAGVSAGGAMAVIMGATYPELFAAIGVHSGLAYKAATNLSEARPAMAKGGADPSHLGDLAFQAMGKRQHVMRVIVFQGAKDASVAVLNADQVIAQWARTNDYLDDGKENNSVDSAGTRKLEGTTSGYAFMRYLYNDHAGKPIMEKWIVQDLKHAWSGGAAGASYSDPKGPDASREMWRFFKQSRPLVTKSKKRR